MPEQLRIILGITIAIITLVIDLYTDLRLWRRKQITGEGTKDVNHKRGLFLRGIGLGLAAYMIGFPNYWMLVLSSLTVIASAFWLLFDGLYNIFRGFRFFYTGSDDPDDADTDDLFQKHRLWVQIAIKLVCIWGSIWLLTTLH